MTSDPKDRLILAMGDELLRMSQHLSKLAESPVSRPIAIAPAICPACRGRGGWEDPEEGQWVTCNCKENSKPQEQSVSTNPRTHKWEMIEHPTTTSVAKYKCLQCGVVRGVGETVDGPCPPTTPEVKIPDRLGIGAPIGTPPSQRSSQRVQEAPPSGYFWGKSASVPSPFDTTAQEAVRCLLRLIGLDPSSPEVKDTPKRVVRALQEMTAGMGVDPASILGTVFEETCDEVIILKGIEFTSLCEHHLLPFSGTTDIGYIPGKVVGLSKLARLVDCISRRPQMQERMTRQIAEALQTHLQAQGVAVVSRGVHSCMCYRGVRKPGAEMVCSSMLGAFRDNHPARAEFLALCGKG